MIGIVVVSHSRALAEAAVDLARQMLDDSTAPRVVVASGLDSGELGTDATAVAAAIGTMTDLDGVLVLLDLGSAVLSGEMALEFLEPDLRHRVRLSAAPLVEGLVVAAVTASTGADLDTVATEAANALAGKADHLDPGGAATDLVPEAPPDAMTADLRVADPHGLHARPAAAVVTAVRGLDAAVWLTNLDNGRGPVSAVSMSAVATLDARHGALVRVSATGAEADDALQALTALLADGVGGSAPVIAPVAPGAAEGSGLDVALGRAQVVRAEVDLGSYEAGDPEAEAERSGRAVAATASYLDDLAARAGADAAAILAAQRTLLDDPAVADPVARDVAAGTAAPHAWRDRLDAVAAEFERLEDPYQRERATDVRSVRAHLLRELTGTATPAADDDRAPVVLVVDELDAATAATVDPSRVVGIVAVAGGPTGHGALVARARGIPLLTGAGRQADGVRDGQPVGFDARAGTLWTDPDEADRTHLEDVVATRTAERARVLDRAAESAITQDGRCVPVLANVSSVAEAEQVASWADGAGLVRTELLFADRDTAPDVDEQAKVLAELAVALGDKPVTIRTWDVGTDKPLPYFPSYVEENPALGVRGVRMIGTPAEPLLRDQLSAICRVATEHRVRVMFPMVTERREVDEALSLLDAAALELGGVPAGLEVGVMVEVPAAALLIEELAEGLDFVSIGTNDLTQYVMAADRGNPAVAHLAGGVAPAVLRLVGRVVTHRPAGLTVAVCGDLASRPDAVPLLLELGVDELSCAPARIPEVKAAVRDYGGPAQG